MDLTNEPRLYRKINLKKITTLETLQNENLLFKDNSKTVLEKGIFKLKFLFVNLIVNIFRIQIL